MSIQTFFKSLTSTPTRRRPIRRRPPASRLCLEALEDRCLLSFSPAVNYPVGLSPQAVVTGDFNGDGRLDLAVANQSSSTVSILLGNADGAFQAAQNFATGAGPQSLAVGDFNKDGKLDLVTANGNANDVSVLLGTGNGTFQAPQSLVLPPQFPPGYTGSTALPQAPTSVTVGDLNGDGKLDLAVRGETTYTVFTPTGYYGGVSVYFVKDVYVNVLLGNGDASFTPKADYHLDNIDGPTLALGDFNGDGKLDVLAVFNHGGSIVLPGNGDGTLQAPVHSASGGGFNSVVTGDLNGDGKLDLVTNDGFYPVSVQKGNGDGTFQTPQTLAIGGSSVRSLVLGDVNGDGKLDITALTSETHYGSHGYSGNYDPTTTSYAKVLLGSGDGSFTLPTSSTLGSHAGFDSFTAAALGDFNGDGRSDLAVTDSSTNTVSVALNGNDWSGPAFIAVGGFPATSSAGVADTFAATIRDSFGNIDTGYRGTVQLSSTDSQAVLPGPYTFTAADGGTHSFSATLKTAGTQSLTVTDTTTGSLTGTETGISVNPAAASTFTLTPFPSSITAGVAHNFIITALDPYGNIATGYGGVVDFSSSDPQAVLPPNLPFPNGAWATGIGGFSATFNTAGTQSLTATDTTNASLNGTQGGITVHAAVKALAVAGFPSPITAGVAGSVTVTARDGNGNVATWYTGTVVFSSSDGQAVLPATYTFTAADQGVHTFSAILKTAGTQSITVKDTATVALSGSEGGITVNPAAASKFLISAPASVRSGVAFSLTITVQDAYGNVVTGYTGTIHFKSTDGRASLPANYTFTAADKGVHTFAGLVLRKKGTQKITLTDTLNSSLAGSVIENVL
jgi:hypothetical protein